MRNDAFSASAGGLDDTAAVVRRPNVDEATDRANLMTVENPVYEPDGVYNDTVEFDGESTDSRQLLHTKT